MHRVLAGTLATIVLVAGAPARASNTYDYLGGCELYTLPDTGSSQTEEGLLVILAVASSDGADPTQVSASMVCELRVDGTAVGGVAAAGSPVLANAGRVSYTVSGDYVEICETVTFDGSWTTTRCQARSTPQPLTDAAVDAAAPIVEDVIFEHADPHLCPRLSAVGGTYGTVTVDPHGDVFLGADQLWDCPPYGDGALNRRLIVNHAGGITITDSGDGPIWTATGIFTNRNLWRGCYRASTVGAVEVVCEPYFGARMCNRTAMTAVSLPTFTVGGIVHWGQVRTSAECMGSYYTQRFSTETADAPPQQQYKSRLAWFFPQPPWRVSCIASTPSWTGAPKAPYFADCQFHFR